MANKWLAHVKKTMKSNKGMKFGQVLKLAKKTYKGGSEGGVEPAPSSSGPFSSAAGTGGRRRSRRRSRKTRRGGMGEGY